MRATAGPAPHEGNGGAESASRTVGRSRILSELSSFAPANCVNGLAFPSERALAMDATFQQRRFERFHSTSHGIRLGSCWFLMHKWHTAVHMPCAPRRTRMSRAHQHVNVITRQMSATHQLCTSGGTSVGDDQRMQYAQYTSACCACMPSSAQRAWSGALQRASWW